MIEETYLPLIKTCFVSNNDNSNSSIHSKLIYTLLKKTLPTHLFISEDNLLKNTENQKKSFQSILPFLSYKIDSKIPGSLSLYVIHKYRSNAFKFFFELVSRWLVPGKRLNVVLVYAVDFYFPALSEDLYTLCEIIIDVDNARDLVAIQNHLPILETEVKLGLESSYYARRILESKGLSTEEKTALIHEYIANLIQKFPKHFDLDLLSEMQHFMVICRDDFKSFRHSRHLMRIISIQYLFRKWLREAVMVFPGKRHLSLKISRANLADRKGTKKVLFIIVGVNLFKEKEVFQKKHLLKAIQNYLPSAVYVENSFYSNYTGNEGICILYMEIEKKTGEEFSEQEITLLRLELPNDLKDRIELPMHPIFMPRNEEEIMRNILALSHQIKFVRDIPQITISFDEQTGEHLFFTVILVRVLKSTAKPIQELFMSSDTKISYIHDRSKNIGLIRKKHIKEANVFHLKLSKENFLRKDHSIDLFKARQFIISEIVRLVGEIRDFNGGMIAKQTELLCAVRESLGNEFKYSELLLENFFCSLLPIGAKAVIRSKVLKKLFTMLVEALDTTLLDNCGYLFNTAQDSEHVYIMIKEERSFLKEKINPLFVKMGISPSHIVQSHVIEQGISYLGVIYYCTDVSRQENFLQTLLHHARP